MSGTREKLIELLGKAQDIGTIVIPTGQGELYEWVSNQKVADYLIANGVTFATDNNVGRWIIRSNGKGDHATNWAECSECHTCGSPQWKVCPVCETKMDGDNDGNL